MGMVWTEKYCDPLGIVTEESLWTDVTLTVVKAHIDTAL